MQYQANVSVCYEKATKIFKLPQINNVNDLATNAVQYSGTENSGKGNFAHKAPEKVEKNRSAYSVFSVFFVLGSFEVGRPPEK